MSLIIGTTTSGQILRGARTDTADAEYSAAAIEYLRSRVSQIPGTGIISGLCIFKGIMYAARDDEFGTECIMYRSTAGGWEVMPTPHLLPGGRFEFITYNFTGNVAGFKMYAVDGVNKGLVFNDSSVEFITTGMADDTPKHLIAHKNHLFYSFAGGSIQHSSIGDPTTWNPITGAAELAVGQECTGFVGVAGEALAIFGRNSTWILNGSSVADWTLNTVDNESGAVEWTLQRFRNPIYLDDRGLTNLEAVQAYGDFKSNSLSQKIQTLMDKMKSRVTASVRIKDKNQYRLFFDDGRCIIFAFDGNKLIGASVVNYGKVITTIVSIECIDGSEVVAFGCDDGFVYRMDSGTSFDGEPVEAWIRPAFNHLRSPENKKRFFKAVLELDAKQPMELTFLPEFSYGSPNLPPSTELSIDVAGGGNAFDAGDAYWRDFYWDSQMISSAEGHIDGIGKNLSLFIRSVGTYEQPHTIQGIIIHYSVRGISR